MVSVSNGLLVKQENLGNGIRKDYWELKLPHAPYLAAIAVGNFGKVESKWNDIPLGYYVEKGYEKGASIVFQHTPEMIGFFGEIIGVTFPWPKYDQIVVRDFVSGAMENTTASIFMEEVRLNEREALDSEWDYIIAHELFHQWFGDYVTSESWANLTLNEAFANYSEYLWNEHKYGKDQAALKLVTEMEGYFSEAEDKQVNLIRFDYSDSEDMFDSHSYNKGGVILHMLRRHLGDDAFFKGLQDYLKRNAFQSVEVHDLRLAMERVSGEDLNWFFNQWFLDKGHPELLFEIDYTIPENILITAVQVQDLEESPLFQLPVEVSWYEEGQRKSKLFQMNRAFQQFALENEKPVDLVFIDEGKNLLARRVQEISSEDFAKQFQQSDLGVARYEALDSLISRTEEDLLLGILPLAIQDEFWSVREKSLGFLQSDSKWGELMPGLEEKIYELAENDPKNSVRSAAIDLLASWNPEKYLTAFQRWANHPSYLIAGSALMGILASDPETIDPGFVNGFSNENNFRIVLPVAEYYISKPVSGKGNWFFEKAGQLNNEGMYYFLGYFSEYFSRFPEEGKEKALDFLLSKMKSESKNFIRLGAFQALMGFADEKDVVRKVAEIAALEKDENLRNYYNYFLEAVEGEN
jgi:aminopeptidase N